MSEIKNGDMVLFAGYFYEVAEVKDFPHGKMIGIFDEKKTGHIDYVSPSSVSKLYPCNLCQKLGCIACVG